MSHKSEKFDAYYEEFRARLLGRGCTPSVIAAALLAALDDTLGGELPSYLEYAITSARDEVCHYAEVGER